MTTEFTRAARAAAEALVDDYERVISEEVVAREYLIESILAFGAARAAPGWEWPTTPAAATPEGAVAAVPQTPPRTGLAPWSSPAREGMTRAAILEQVARLERWAAECFPAGPDGRVHFARAVMESVAANIRAALGAP